MGSDKQDVDSSGTYFMSVEDFEARAPSQTREEALLESLREGLDAPQLEWAEAPRQAGVGAESIVLGVALRNAGEWSELPLVARLLQSHDADQLTREAAIQAALADAGFPAPRPVAHGRGRPGVLEPFLLMERVPGRVLFSLIPMLAGAWLAVTLLGLGALGLLIWIGWYGLAVALQRRLHALPVEPIERTIAEHGLDPAELGDAAWVERLATQAKRLELHVLDGGVAWLRTNLPSQRERVVCHGDYWAGNIMVSLRGVTGLIDWANAGIAPREFDLGWNRVQDAGDLPFAQRLAEPWRDRLGAIFQPLVWIALLPHRWLYRLFGGVDSRTLDYYTAFHCLRILIWSFERERAAHGAANPWSSPRARKLVASRFKRITGVELGTAR